MQQDGSVSIAPLPPLAIPPKGAIDDLGNGAWLVARLHHLLILRDGKTLWRSWRHFARAREAWGTLRGSRFVLVTYRPRGLYVGRLGGRERLVARDEEPIGWSADGELYTYRPQRLAVRLRAGDGRLIGRIAAPVTDFQLESDTKTLLYVTEAGRLFRADGYRRHKLRDLAVLGFRPRSGRWIEPLEAGMIGVFGRQRAVVLRHDGSLFGFVPFRTSRLVSSPDGRSVAFSVPDESRGSESVYVTAAGGLPRLLQVSHLDFAPCAHWVDLLWHGDWVLYATTEGNAVAVDTATGARVDLTDFARTLPGNETSEEGEVGPQEVRWAEDGALGPRAAELANRR